MLGRRGGSEPGLYQEAISAISKTTRRHRPARHHSPRHGASRHHRHASDSLVVPLRLGQCDHDRQTHNDSTGQGNSLTYELDRRQLDVSDSVARHEGLAELRMFLPKQ